MYRVLAFILFFGISQRQLLAQDTLSIDLESVIQQSVRQAPDAQIARTQLNNNYWRYQSFLADFKPQVDLNATLPNLNRAIDAITQPDGTDIFVNRSLMSNGVGISLSQDIPLTGGTVFARTDLERIDIFETESQNASQSYLSTPIRIGLIQPIFSFNQMKWNRIIEPLRYEEATKAYSEDQAQIAYQATEFYFQVLIAQFNLRAAQRDKADADTLLRISRGRYEVGKIAETELLQIELNAQNAEVALAQSQFTLQNTAERLRDFMGIQQATAFDLQTPAQLPDFAISVEQALQYARENRSQVVALQRRIREAERDRVRAEQNSGLNMDLTASFGLSQTATDLSGAYQEPLDQQRLSLGLSIPLADWGKTRAQREIARSNEELVSMQVQQDRLNFERDIIIRVQQFEQIKNQVSLADRSFEIARRRLRISRQRYRIGKISITDLNLAISEEANARRSYITSLRDYWLAYYDLQRLTLFDFNRQESLVIPIQNGRPRR